MPPVYLEVSKRKVFACAVDWPGWCRSGKDEDQALEALAAYAPRYARVAATANVPFKDAPLEVVEMVSGSASTEFGVPGEILERDRAPVARKEAERLAGLVEAAWREFDRTVKASAAELRKGPRGGGRDRDKIVEHALGSEVGYGRQIGVRISQPGLGDRPAIQAAREAILERLREPKGASDLKWPLRYAARRIAWHALDHAWEIEDRQP